MRGTIHRKDQRLENTGRLAAETASGDEATAAAKALHQRFGFRRRRHPVVGEIRELNAWDFASDKALDGGDVAFLFGRHERVGVADLKVPARAADPVDVILGFFRDVKIDDVTE